MPLFTRLRRTYWLNGCCFTYFAKCEIAAGPWGIFSLRRRWENYSFRYKTFHTANSKLSRPVTWYLHGDLEDPEEPERPEHGQAEGACLGLEVRPDLLEGGERYDEGVEAVEGGLHVDADAQRPHPQEHLEDEQPEENEFGSVCGGKKRERLI